MAFKDLIKSLPLESISETLAQVVLWWIQLVKNVPEDKLPVYTYIGASLLVLLLLFVVLRIFPRAIRGIAWLISAAVLLTPGTTGADSGGIAPAIIGVLHGFLMGDGAQAMKGVLSILAVIVAGLVLGGVWQLLRAGIEARLKAAQETRLAKEAEQAAEIARCETAEKEAHARIQAVSHQDDVI